MSLTFRHMKKHGKNEIRCKNINEADRGYQTGKDKTRKALLFVKSERQCKKFCLGFTKEVCLKL